MCGVFVFSVPWGLRLESPPALLAQPWYGDKVACSQHHCACNSVDVISNMFVPPFTCLFSLRFLNLQVTDTQLFLLFIHLSEENNCSYPQILPLSKYIASLSTSHPGEWKHHIFIPVPQWLSQLSPSSLGVRGDIEKKSTVFIMWGGQTGVS